MLGLADMRYKHRECFAGQEEHVRVSNQAHALSDGMLFRGSAAIDYRSFGGLIKS